MAGSGYTIQAALSRLVACAILHQIDPSHMMAARMLHPTWTTDLLWRFSVDC